MVTLADGSILRPRMTGGAGRAAEVIFGTEAPLMIGGRAGAFGTDWIIGGSVGGSGVTGALVRNDLNVGKAAVRTGGGELFTPGNGDSGNSDFRFNADELVAGFLATLLVATN